MIDATRLRQTFLDLVAFDSPPGQEGPVSRWCAEVLHECGFVVQHDEAGNLIAQKSGAVSEAQRIFFSGHVDTVRPTEGLVVREDDGVFRTSGDTILGADDKCAVAAILEGVRVLGEQDVPHGDLQVILSVGEEVGLVGARALATEVIAGGIGFVLDAEGPPGGIISSAPTHRVLIATCRGRAAHAGFEPEKGVSAIQIAARAIDRMRLGRIDPETTANVGIVQGGTATNIVAEEATVRFEARSRNEATLAAQVSHMRQTLETAARDLGGAVEIEERQVYRTYRFTEDDAPVRIAREAWARVVGEDGEPARFQPTGGGSDGSVFNARGVPSLVLTCGYYLPHGVHEWTTLRDMEQCARWVVEIARAAAGGRARDELPA